MSLLSPAYKKKLEQLKKAEGAANLLDLKLKDLSTDAALLAGSSLPPPFGTAADVASLAKSVASGDWGGAFWDAVGFIPIVGDGAKAAVKGTKIARRLKAINKSLDKARDAIRKKKEDLGKLCKKNRKANQGKVTQATKDCGTNCGSGKNVDTAKKIDPPGTYRDPKGRLRNKNGTFAKDPNTVKFNRSAAERRKALLKDARDPNSGLSDRARKQILDSDGKKVPKGYEVSHEKPLYTGKSVEEKRALDRASNMKTQQKHKHRKRHMKCGDQFHDYPIN